MNIIAATLAVFLVKQYTSTGSYKYLILAIISYAMVMIAYINMLRYSDVIAIYSFMQIFELLAVVLVGIILFNETINPSKILGILFGLGSMYFLYQTL